MERRINEWKKSGRKPTIANEGNRQDSRRKDGNKEIQQNAKQEGEK